MAFHTYMCEDVDTAVIECGIGGEYDSTNILTSPTVTSITSLGIDHVAMLGNTIEEIAWHKAGIMKPGVPAYTALQPPTAINVLQERAAERSTSLSIVAQHSELEKVKIGLAGSFQLSNASVAIATAAAHLRSLPNPPPLPSPTFLPKEFIRGLEDVRWPGRCEIRRERDVTWFIDSGHTLESIEAAASWFASQIPPNPTSPPPSTSNPPNRTPRILLFNQQTRDAPALTRALHKTLVSALNNDRPFTHAVFCTNVTFKDQGYRPDLVSMNTSKEIVDALEVQKSLQRSWKELDEMTEVAVKGTIEEAVEWVRELASTRKEKDATALVTGSVHLVGGFLEVLETGMRDDGSG